jgi:hypothetical protein
MLADVIANAKNYDKNLIKKRDMEIAKKMLLKFDITQLH